MSENKLIDTKGLARAWADIKTWITNKKFVCYDESGEVETAEPRDADTLGGYAPNYYAKETEIDALNKNLIRYSGIKNVEVLSTLTGSGDYTMTDDCIVRVFIGYSAGGSSVNDTIRVNGVAIWSKNEPITYHNSTLPLMALKSGDKISFEHGSGTAICTINKVLYN